MQSPEGSKRTRLCRLMCRKARPYSTMDFMRLCLPIRGGASRFPRKAVDGKVQPFRTSGGVAANTISDHPQEKRRFGQHMRDRYCEINIAHGRIVD
jgi:hypothetical protein